MAVSDQGVLMLEESTGRGRRALAGCVALLVLVGLVTGCDTSSIVADGVVSSASGAGVGGVTVVAYADDAERSVASTSTNVFGEWTFRAAGITDGTYRLRIGDRWWPEASTWVDATPVTFSATDPAHVTARIDVATRLTGSVVHADLSPAPGRFVLAGSTDGALQSSTTTDASGAFRLPLTGGAGDYRLWVGDASGENLVEVGGGSPATFTVDDGHDLRVGAVDAATGVVLAPDTVATAVTGPYVVGRTTVPAGNGFGGGTIYAPTSDTHAPYGAVIVTPGFLMTQAQMSWYGPRLASQGFVVFTIDTNATTDVPSARATQMLAALDWLTTESPVASRVDSSRAAVMGWSMGGGGSLDAGLSRPSLKAVIALAPWESRSDYSALRVPTLVVGCQNDSIAPVANYAGPMYASLSADLPREYIEIAGEDHFCVTTNVDVPAERTVIARQTLGFLQRYVNGDEAYAGVVCPPPAVGGVLSASRSGCPF